MHHVIRREFKLLGKFFNVYEKWFYFIYLIESYKIKKGHFMTF